MKDLTKPRGWKSRLSAIVLSVVIALAFMPSFGAADEAKAYEGEWGIYCGDIYLYYGQSCTLRAVVDYYDGETPEIVSYAWYSGTYDEETGDVNYKATPTYTGKSAEYKVENVKGDQYWKCVATEKGGDSEEASCSIGCEKNLPVNPENEETYEAMKGDDVTVIFKIPYEELDDVYGEPKPDEYRWYKLEYVNEDDEEATEILIAKTTTPVYTFKKVSSDMSIKCVAYAGGVVTEDYVTAFIAADDLWSIGDEFEDGEYYYAQGDKNGVTIKPTYTIDYEPGVDPAKIKLTYAWYEDMGYGEEDYQWKKLPGKTAKELTVSGLTEDKYFRLEISDQFGTVRTIDRFVEVITKEKKAALDVGDAIDKMKETKDLTLADRANVMKAKAAYDALSTDQKNMLQTSQVTKLNEAVKKINDLGAKADKKAIAKAKKMKVKGFKVKAAKGKKATVKWKVTKGAKGYQIMYSMNKKFKKAKKIKIKKGKTKKAVIKKLKAKKKYFVKIRPYSVVKKANGKKITVYGKWSKVKKVKAKK